jgi:chromosome partitioning protein
MEIEEARTYLQNAGYDVLPGAIPEMTGYRRATDKGRALTETRYDTLNHHAEEVIQGIVDRISHLSASNKKRSVA